MADTEGDVVTLLLKQHERIRELFDEVFRSEGSARRDAFQHLVRTLTVHETAEEEIVHPYARKHLDKGGAVVERRLDEEKEAKESLASLERLDPHDPDFLDRLESLRDAVLAHAASEEKEEFACLQEVTDQRERRALAAGMRAAEALAPTHPRPGTESAAGNAALGPLAAVADRTRDAVRSAMK
ncbi:hemerythrin domain-containing protein [Streptomyces sp. ODS28]|uniref:hemerythrin domain-containing protein n=1 Tax=Streptomyces sp. ODS28 TaxID=3136688 RepID=UPI0031ED1D82